MEPASVLDTLTAEFCHKELAGLFKKMSKWLKFNTKINIFHVTQHHNPEQDLWYGMISYAL